MTIPTGPMTAQQTIQLLPPAGRVALYAAAAVLGAVLPSVQLAVVLVTGVVPLWLAVTWSLFGNLTTAFGLIAVNNVTKRTDATPVVLTPSPDDLPGEVVPDQETAEARLREELAAVNDVNANLAAQLLEQQEELRSTVGEMRAQEEELVQTRAQLSVAKRVAWDTTQSAGTAPDATEPATPPEDPEEDHR